MEDMSAIHYEILIRKAYNCSRYGKTGADKDIFQNLTVQEYYLKENPNDKKLQKEFSKSLEKVKGYISDALQKGIKQSGKKDFSKLSIVLDRVKEIVSTKELSEQVENAHAAFDDLGIVMS